MYVSIGLWKFNIWCGVVCTVLPMLLEYHRYCYLSTTGTAEAILCVFLGVVMFAVFLGVEKRRTGQSGFQSGVYSCQNGKQMYEQNDNQKLVYKHLTSENRFGSSPELISISFAIVTTVDSSGNLIEASLTLLVSVLVQ